MPYPNFKNKYLEKALFQPSDFLKKYRKEGVRGPRTVIFCYNKFLLDFSVSFLKAVPEKKSDSTLYRLGETGLFLSPIGAPAASVNMEEFIAMGTERFISLGTAGGLSKNLKHGSIIICAKALRDEGTSHHYLPPDNFSFPDMEFTTKLEKILNSAGIHFLKGPTWTIDAPYRETIRELIKYREEGILTVEMEAAALFAVAKYRKVKAAGIFIISDTLDEKGWKPGFHFKTVRKNLENLLTLLTGNLE